MKLLVTIILYFLSLMTAKAQWDCMHYIEVDNGIRANVSDNIGSLSTRLFPKNMPSTSFDSDAYCFIKSLWLGGYDDIGNLRIAANVYPDLNDMEFFPGPLDQASFTPVFDQCPFINMQWKFTYEEIENFQSNYENGILDEFTIPEDFISYPAIGNLWYEENHGIKLNDNHAPFFDRDNNGIYNPFKGDFPIALKENPCFTPHQFSYSIYNDIADTHTGTHGNPLGVEVRLTTYVVEENSSSILNYTSFQRVVVENKSPDVISQFRVGHLTDDDMGTGFYDDFIGCDTLNNLIYSYSQNGIDSKDGSTGVMIHMCLNRKMNGFVPLVNYQQGFPPPPTNSPILAEHYYNNLNGLWLDGSSLTIGEMGYDINSTNFTKFAYPDKPSDTNGWSLQTAQPLNGYYHAITSIADPDLFPGDLRTYDFAELTWIDPNTTGIEKIDEIDSVVEEIREFYLLSTSSPLNSNLNKADLTIAPNPASDRIVLSNNQEYPYNVSIWDSNGQLILTQTIKDVLCAIDISQFSKGYYLIRKENDSGLVQVGRFIKI